MDTNDRTPYLHLDFGPDQAENRNLSILDDTVFRIAQQLLNGLILPGSLGQDLLAKPSVGTPELYDGAVTAAKIAPGVIVWTDTSSNLQPAKGAYPVTTGPLTVNAPPSPNTVTELDLLAMGTISVGQVLYRRDLQQPLDATPAFEESIVATQGWAPGAHGTAWSLSTTFAGTNTLRPVLVAHDDGRVTGLTDPLFPADLATKRYVDAGIAGIGGGPPGGPAGGSLTGTYPNPTIAPLAVHDAAINDVAWAKITGAPTGQAPGGPAGGALTGTYPNPGVQYSMITGLPTSMAPAGAAGGDLAGSTYPNPVVAGNAITVPKLAIAVQNMLVPLPTLPAMGAMFLQADPGGGYVWNNTPFLDTGAVVTLAIATRQVTLPGPTAAGAGVDQSQILAGSRSAKVRLHSLPGLDVAALTINRRYDGSAWNQDDATKPSWALIFDDGSDATTIQRQPAGGAGSVLLSLNNAGILAIPGNTTNGATVQLGSQTAKSRLQAAAGTLAQFGWFANRNWAAGTNAQDDTTQTSWGMQFRCDPGSDQFVIQHAPINSTTQATPFIIDGPSGQTFCTLGAGTVTNVMTAPGITIRQMAQVNYVASFNVGNTSTWTPVATTPAMNVRANARVLLISAHSSMGFYGASSNFYYGFGYDGGTSNLTQQNWQIGAGTIMPTPYVIITGALAAGSHTFTFWNWSGGGTIVYSTSPGSFYAFELA